MRMRIVDILDRGVPNKERIHISVDADTDLQFFVVLETMSRGSAIQAGGLQAFWFPAKEVKAGEMVLLFTAGGTESTFVAEDKVKVHLRYWGRKNTIFHAPTSTAALMEVAEWATFVPGPLPAAPSK